MGGKEAKHSAKERKLEEEGGAIKGREEGGKAGKDGRRGPETGKQGPALSSAAGCLKLGSPPPNRKHRHRTVSGAALGKRGNR